MDAVTKNRDLTTLQDALRSFAKCDTMRTHSEGCWRWHPKCAMMYAADVIDEYCNV